MLYINKEYGFDGKPPYFKEFYEEATKGQVIKKSDFPQNNISGLGLDSKYCLGGTLVHNNGSIFGVRVAVLDHDEWIDGNEFLSGKNSRILAATNDDSFLALNYKSIIVKFSAISKNEIAFSVESSKNATVRVIFYPVYFTKSKFIINGNHVVATSDAIATLMGDIKFNSQDIFEVHNRYHVYNASKTQAKFCGEVFNDADLIDNGAFGEAIFEYNLVKGKNKIYGHAYLDDVDFKPQVNSLNDCFYNLNNKEIEFSKHCLTGSGTLAKNATIVGRNALLNLIYEPYLKQSVATSNRNRINEHFAMHRFSDALSAILACNFCDYNEIFEECKILVSEKAAGATLLLNLYKQGLEVDKLKSLYDEAKKSFDTTNILETEKDRTSEIFSVYKTCLKIFNLEVLELISNVVDNANTNKYTKLISELKQLVNTELYSEAHKTYLNKTLEGEFIENTGSRKFYVLLAGVVTADRLEGVLQDLLNTKTFFSEYGILENSKRNRKKERIVDAFTNYLIYNGLRRYNLFNECASLATKTSKLWDEINLKGIKFSLCYNVGFKVKSEGGFNLAANLLGLIGINEVISFDLNKLTSEKTLSFGSVKSGQLIQNYLHNKHIFDIKQSDKDTILVIDNIQVLKIDDATTTVSSFIETKSGCEFMVNATKTARIELKLPFVPIQNKKQYGLAFVLPAGKSLVKIEGAKVNVKPL